MNAPTKLTQMNAPTKPRTDSRGPAVARLLECQIDYSRSPTSARKRSKRFAEVINALEVLLSSEDIRADQAEAYGSISLSAAADLDTFVDELATVSSCSTNGRAPSSFTKIFLTMALSVKFCRPSVSDTPQAAFGDLFNDDHIDVVLNVMDSTPVLLRNTIKNSNHWLTLKLVGGPKSPRDAIGANVFVTTGTIRQRADVFSGGSYASSSFQRVHFGLGAATKVDKVEILWPDGVNEEIRIPAIDRIVSVVEGKGIVEP